MARTALYLDFDNVFGGLMKLDPGAALQFAQDPESWLGRLSSSLTVEGPRRWLVLRCYMNPAGSLPNSDQAQTGSRLYFSRFRPFFTNAGFEVIDCPKLAHTKNAADIRMVLDVVDSLANNAHYDEYVIASGDSDMTPLLVRLRAADRRTTILSPSDAAAAFTSVADRLINGPQVLELMQGDDEPEDGLTDIDHLREAAPAGIPEGISPSAASDPEGYAVFGKLVRERYEGASEAINLSALATDVRSVMGVQIDESDWFGRGGFVRCLRDVGLEDLRISQHFMWHAERHAAPPGVVPEGALPLAEPVERVRAMLGLPRLPRNSWTYIYTVLAEYIATHPFNMTEATRWSRDNLVAQGVEVNRRVIGLVATGSAYGGFPLYSGPPPSAGEIRKGFITNVLKRAEAAEIQMSSADTAAVTLWLGGLQPLDDG